jgi:hypothetical protein
MDGCVDEADRFGLVTGVENNPWTYAPAGTTCDTAVAVAYLQHIGRVRQSRDVETTVHSVPVGGQYRRCCALNADGEIPGCS